MNRTALLGEHLARIREVEDSLVDEPGAGIDELVALTRRYHPAHKTESLLIAARWKQLSRAERKLGASEETKRQRNEILAAALSLVHELHTVPSQTSEASGASEVPPEAPSAPVVAELNDVCRARKGLGRFTLRGVSLSLRAGRILGVAGANGSGKSTLLRIIAGDLAADSGRVEYPALCLRNRDWEQAFAQIAYVPQTPPSWPSTLETQLTALGLFGGISPAQIDARVDEVLAILGLSRWREHRWSQLSGGTRTRCALASALVTAPKMLVLDEPLAALDLRAQQVFLRHLRDLARHPTEPLAIVVSSQHLPEIESVADDMMLLCGGDVEWHGPVASIAAERTTNLFALDSPRGREAIRDLLSALEGVSFPPWIGVELMVETPREVTAERVLGTLHGAGVPVRTFRDLSRSTARTLVEAKDGG